MLIPYDPAISPLEMYPTEVIARVYQKYVKGRGGQKGGHADKPGGNFIYGSSQMQCTVVFVLFLTKINKSDLSL